MKIKKLYMFIPLILIVLISGCITEDTNLILNTAKASPTIQAFLSDYPNAEVNIRLLKKSIVETDSDFIAQCAGVEVSDYYKVVFTDKSSGLNAFAFIDKESGVVCAFKEGAEVCNEDWSCTEWSDCIDGIQTRTCTDSNNCDTMQNKPLESQICSGGENIFEGEPDFLEDGIYVFVDLDTSIRTTNEKYIIQLKKIDTPDSCAKFDIFKKQGQVYEKIGSTSACKSLLGRFEGEDFVIEIVDVDAANQKVLGLVLSENFILEDTSVDHPDIGMAMFVKEGEKIELLDGVYKYILEVFRVADNGLIKIFRKSLITEDYEFKGVIPVGEGVVISNTRYEISIIAAGIGISEKTVGTIQFSKTFPKFPENAGELVEGANLLVEEGTRFKNDDYIIDLTDIREDNSSILKIYANTFGEYRFSGVILALEGVVSSNSLNQVAIKTDAINFQPGKIGSLVIATSKTFFGFPDFTGDGNYTNVEKGQSIESSNGYILKIVGIEDGMVQILVYYESFGEKKLQGAIVALDGVVSSSTSIPVTVQTADSNGTTGTIGSINLIST